MANKSINIRVLCPFFIAESKKSISCEGVAGCKTVSCFEFTEDKEAHEEKFCTTGRYCDCRLCKTLMENYLD